MVARWWNGPWRVPAIAGALIVASLLASAAGTPSAAADALMFAAAALAGAIVYRALRQDIAILALLSYATIAVLTAGLAELLDGRSFLALNGLGLFVIFTSAAAGLWLMRLHREGRGEEATS